jgi:SAM-dependent methyltransferase
MGAAAHLGIDLAEYDARIRTFVAGYDELLETAATALRTTVRARAPLVVDLGIGTGGLSQACLKQVPRARIFGIDADKDMIAMARRRLGRRLTHVVHDSFERADIPRCDAVIASLALHHIPTPARRLRLFRRLRAALRPGGVLISADSHPSPHSRLAALGRAASLRHLERSYSPSVSRGYLRAWAREDHHVTLPDELALLQRAGFQVDVASRRRQYAVVVAAR